MDGSVSVMLDGVEMYRCLLSLPFVFCICFYPFFFPKILSKLPNNSKETYLRFPFDRREQLNIRQSLEVEVLGIMLFSFYGGSDPTWAPSYDTYAYFRFPNSNKTHRSVTQPPSFFPETSPFRSEVVSGVQCSMKNYY